MRTPLLAGNWKMYKTPAETKTFFDAFVPMVSSVKERQIAICPPYIDLAVAIEAAKGTNVGIGAQNLAVGKEGAMTGEISGHMLKTIGCRYVIIGHSERRQFFGENEAGVLAKTLAALEYGLTPIVCVGELLAQRESGQTEAVLEAQFDGGIAGLSAGQFASIVIAYEPVWAIGTGKVATPEQAAEAHAFIRGRVALKFGNDQAEAIRILYGGSVKPDNVAGLMSKGDIDGALVGGASLDPKSFASIVNFQ
ncbi:MAG TPA: triose-phosphate isomerase [Bryobacteraceae bacterium]|nr:triose-phosphate isomerase [Bryobacteraceae bacterium]